jgi:hypothetical protein
VNAEQWNALYPVGTLVFAYPGFRPEDDRTARRLVTRTRTKAQISASGDPVVWVDGEGSYICLTHVDPVSESVWQAAKDSEACGAREPEPRTGTSPCVLPAGHGGSKHQDKWTNQWPALPVPVGDQPQPLDDAQLAEIRAARHTLRSLAAADCDINALLAAVAYHRHWEQVGWQKAHAYNELWGRDNDRLAEERQLVARLRQELSRQGRAHKAEIERLKAALSEAADQVAELESDLAEAHQKKAAALASARQLMNRNRTEEAAS